MAKKSRRKDVEALRHTEASRKNLPSAEHEAVMTDIDRSPIEVAYERRNRDLDPQLVWRGKDLRDWSDLVVQAPPLFIQEKVHPKALVDDLLRRSKNADADGTGTEAGVQTDLFADFNGLPSDTARTEFYQHDANWSNRMILGDSLLVMASLAEREGLREKVQCIYIDPPYGIKFNSNFQWSTTSRDVKDGRSQHISREPEQVRAFRDTWRDGIHSYLTYLRDRLTVSRDLLTKSGSVFVQIGDKNLGRVRSLMDEVFGAENFVAQISFAKTTGFSGSYLSSVCDYLVWYAKALPELKFRPLFETKQQGQAGALKYRRAATIDALRNSSVDLTRLATSADLTSQGASSHSQQSFTFRGRTWMPPSGLHWKTTVEGLDRLAKAGRIIVEGKSIRYVRFLDDFSVYPRTNVWQDVGGVQSRTDPKVYVVQTATEAVKRCILMTTDPGDLVLDPTCGSGTTAYVSEQWGRRWITIDTSRVALALARVRIMGARYPYYLLDDSPEGQQRQAEITRSCPSEAPTHGDIRQGFVYERVPHITLKLIASNSEIDIIWKKSRETIEPVLKKLREALGDDVQEWEIPREPDHNWAVHTKETHSQWWDICDERQRQIDASVAANAEFEYLLDRPYEDLSRVRVAGPFTVESISPHRVLTVGEGDDLIDGVAESRTGYQERRNFATMVLENLRTSGVHQSHKEDRITFSAITPWPGNLICAEGSYLQGREVEMSERRAGIFIGPEFGTVVRADLVSAAREAADAGFEVLVSCAFNYDAHASEFARLGRVPILKARMNADLFMADDLSTTGSGNLFVIFGEPDIEILQPKRTADKSDQICVKINGVDVFHPATGEVRSHSADGIACWFVDTDYDEESFFVRHAYFLGANDPYKSLKITLKAEINREAWSTLNSDISRPFRKPNSGRIAVKVINHLGDEVMKVFRI